jgi:TP901-1 family phage major tail protein
MAEAKTYVLGMKAEILQGAADAELSAMTAMTNTKDVTLTMEAGEADITTRGNSGWRATAPTLRSCSAEFQQIWKPGDAGFEAIKTAFLTNSTIELAILDGPHGESGSQGPKGQFSITNFSRNEPLEEAITVSVTAKLAKFDEWVVVAGA